MTTSEEARLDDAVQTVAWFANGWTDPTYDEFCDYFLTRMHPQVRLIQPLAATGVGRAAFRKQFARLFATVPDINAEVLKWSSHGPDVFIEIALHGTIGWRSVTWYACDRLTVHDGMITERHSYFDPIPLVKAIALRPWAWPRLTVTSSRSIVTTHRIQTASRGKAR